MGLEELSPEKRAAYLERLRRMPLRERFLHAADVIDRGRAFIVADLRRRNPQASERELQRLLAVRLCGTAIADRVYRRP